jgi:hypothetical protein
MFSRAKYDYLKDSQIHWFRQQSQSMKMIERPYKPPVLEDATFGNIDNDIDGNSDRRRAGMTGPRRLTSRQEIASTLKKPNAMAIFHIPLREVYDTKPDVGKDGKALIIGSQKEDWGSPTKGDFFAKGLLKQTELGSDTDAEGDAELAIALNEAKPEVKVILNGELMERLQQKSRPSLQRSCH